MPKQLINLIGVVVAIGILVLAVMLGVVPQITAALSTNSQADQVAATNSVYQARIAQLQRQKQNMTALNASVAKLHRQIPAEYRLDDVFLLVASSADTAKATITSVTAGDPAAFVQRTAPVPAGQPTPAPGAAATPAATPAPSASAAPSATPAPAPAGPNGASAGQGRTQIEITINVTVADTKSAARFLDALRSGPRLLANVTSTMTGGAGSVSLQVSGLAFAEPSTAAAAKGGN